MAGAEELLDGSVIRLAKVAEDFPQDSARPLPKHFAPTSDERAQAAATGVLKISVWDSARTTVPQARQIRRAGGETVAFDLDVAKVRSIEIPDSNPPRTLRIFRDEIEPELSHMPGADGHCGLQGLGDESCAKPRDRKHLRSKLCDIAIRLPE